jgi:hypothetical protein
MAFIGVASAAVERREASPLRIFFRREEDTEGAAVPRKHGLMDYAPPGAPPPSSGGLLWNGLAKLGRGGVARTIARILPRDSGEGGPREAWWKGRGR